MQYSTCYCQVLMPQSFPTTFKKLKITQKITQQISNIQNGNITNAQEWMHWKTNKEKKNDMKIEHYNDVGQLKLYLEW